MKLLQVCNVGTVCGGTGACAWSVVQALAEWEHGVVLLSRVTEEARREFAGCWVREAKALTRAVVSEFGPDVLLMHNTSCGRVEGDVRDWGMRSVMYLHSRIRPAAAERVVCCSKWLAGEMELAEEGVLWQGVEAGLRDSGLGISQRGEGDRREAIAQLVTPEMMTGEARSWAGRLVVGRMATPVGSKWRGELVEFYRELAGRCPWVWWEFVGCPRVLQAELRAAVRGRVRFHAAGWEARVWLQTWDVLLHYQPQVTESFGRTVAEGMLAGCVPVVDGRGGFCEQVMPGCGFLCRSVEEYVTALEALRYAPLRRQMQRAGARLAREQFSLEAFGERLRKVLDVESKASPGGIWTGTP